RYFNKDKDLGSIAPGKCADIIVLDDLKEVEPSIVITDGQIIVEDNELSVKFTTFTYPESIKSSVHVGRQLTLLDFDISSKKSNSGIGKQCKNGERKSFIKCEKWYYST